MDEMKCPKQRYLLRLSFLTVYCFFFFFHRLTVISASNDSAPYVPTDEILLDTGSSGNSTAKDGRQWTGDIGTQFALFPQSNGATLAVNAKSSYGVPYSTARMSRSNFTYNFPVTYGPKFIRLLLPNFIFGIQRFRRLLFCQFRLLHPPSQLQRLSLCCCFEPENLDERILRKRRNGESNLDSELHFISYSFK